MKNAISRRFLLVGSLAAWLVIGSPVLGAENPPAASDAEAAEIVPEVMLLGRFMLRDFRVTEGTKLRLSFALYAEIDPEYAEVGRAVGETHRHRIRNEVITAVRTAQQRDFHEPELERFRRRIYLRLRRTAPYLKIERLLIGEFELLVWSPNSGAASTVGPCRSTWPRSKG